MRSSRCVRRSSGLGWRLRFGDEDLVEDGHEIVAPAAHGRGVLRAESGEGLEGAIEVGPPFEGVAAAEDQCDVERRLNVLSAETFEVELLVPGHLVDRAVVERVGVVEEAGTSGIFDRRQSASGDLSPFEADRLEASSPEVGLKNQGIVAGAEDYAVVSFVIRHSYGRVSM